MKIVPTSPSSAKAGLAPSALATPTRLASLGSSASLQPAAERHWRGRDPVLWRLSRANPLPEDPTLLAADGFSTLVLSIVHQQVSMAAARTIQGRLVKLLGGAITPRRILNRTPEQLRLTGLSRAKAACILDLADRTQRGEVEFGRFAEMPDEAILEELVTVKGIGAWTAKMFLLFHLHRPDVLAPKDLGLRLAVADAYGVPPEKAAALMVRQQAAWSPYCTVAARVLWQSRRKAAPAAV